MKHKLLVIITTIAMVLGMTAGVAAANDDYAPVSISNYTTGVYGPTSVHTNNIMDVVVASSDGYANFRSGPGTGYGVIGQIYNGTSVTITGVNQNTADGLVWGQTTYSGMTGWISLRLTKVTNIENSSRAEYDVTVSVPQYIALRVGPGTEYDQILVPKNGQVIRINQTAVNSFDGRPWGRTTINGYTGWISLSWTSRNTSATYNYYKDLVYFNNTYNAYVSSSDGYVNFRSGPSLNNSVITQIYNDTYLCVTGVVANSNDGLVWGLTTYNGTTGWVAMGATRIAGIDNASTAQYRVTVQTSSNLILRKGPGTEYDEILRNVPNGTSLYISQTIINSFDGRPWGLTTINGYTGWVSLDWTYRAPGV